jgi:hypothetical protein
MPEVEPTWLGRHWRWLLGGLAVVVLLVSGGLAVVVFVTSLLGDSDPAKLALATAESHPIVAGSIGQPVKRGWLVTGKLEVSGSSGKAVLDIPVEGPNGRGALYVEAIKTAGEWQLKVLIFVAGDRRLNLLTPEPGIAPLGPTRI